MRIRILSPVNAGDYLLQAGVVVSLPDKEALALVRAKAAEPVGQPAIGLWSPLAAADLAALQLNDARMAERNERATPKAIESIGGRKLPVGQHQPR